MAVKQFCSYVDHDNGQHCKEVATHASTAIVGMWVMGIWTCDAHKPMLEMMQKMPGAWAAQVKFAAVIAPLDYLQVLEDEGRPRPEDLMAVTMTCDRCHEPIYRSKDADGVRWRHVEGPAEGKYWDHNPIPG